ncbi:hypothetical protein ASN18_1114 [Candidatus Magnetominusculus xianensis]|uniref:Uncharacterized protein n=1 Tax=Candidatus Magnetominusculus xianensis TaxID=1748249 RepID=A0ABR5SGV9_9BACT|nr:hypothetical protein ASN18_1114 [Candidatus Magnetominusculus xianensis]
MKYAEVIQLSPIEQIPKAFSVILDKENKNV